MTDIAHALARRAGAGDHTAFAEIILRCRTSLRFLVREFCQELVEADDLMQEALLGYWVACEKFDSVWDVQFTSYAAPFARRRMGHLIRAARTRKARMVADAWSLDEPLDTDTGPVSLADTLPAAECWQPELLAEIRHDLRLLSSELVRELSPVEREALTRVMLDERVGPGREWEAATRMREKASALLGYEWSRPRARTHERRRRGLEMLAAGYTRGDVSRRLGVAQTTVSRWAREERPPEAVAVSRAVPIRGGS